MDKTNEKPMLLAIDTATRTMSLALHDGTTLISEQTWRIGNRHNELLAVSVQKLLQVSGLAVSDLSVIAVANGPGSYTGLRIGVAFAKGLAASRNLPLIAVSTLDILAASQAFSSTRHRLIATVQAGRGRIIAGVYRVHKGRWEITATPTTTTWEALLGQLEAGSYYVTGEINDAGQQAIAAMSAEGETAVMLVAAANRARRAGYLAQEAWRLHENGNPLDFLPMKVLPVYLNEPG